MVIEKFVLLKAVTFFNIKIKFATERTDLAYFCFVYRFRFSGTLSTTMSSSKKLGTFGPVTKKLSEAWSAKLGSVSSFLPESNVQVKKLLTFWELILLTFLGTIGKFVAKTRVHSQ